MPLNTNLQAVAVKITVGKTSHVFSLLTTLQSLLHSINIQELTDHIPETFLSSWELLMVTTFSGFAKIFKK